MARTGHEINGHEEVRRNLGVNSILDLIKKAQTHRTEALKYAREARDNNRQNDVKETVKTAWDWHWILMSALYALGIHKIKEPNREPREHA